MNCQTKYILFFLFRQTFFIIAFLVHSGRGLPSNFFCRCLLRTHYYNTRARMRVPACVLFRWMVADSPAARREPGRVRAGRVCQATAPARIFHNAAHPGGHVPAERGAEFSFSFGLETLRMAFVFYFFNRKIRANKKGRRFPSVCLNCLDIKL